ncbi:MAG: dTMP kinase [Pseudomonadota bacterium]
MFITFEGIDGSGKSSQSRRLAEWLREANRSVVLTREPGGSTGAEAIRELLVTGEPGRWSPMTEMLLFTAARRDHLEKTILPALERGDTVICDRFVDSTRVYQGATRGAQREIVDEVHDIAIGREADVTLVIDLNPKIALSRGLARGSGEDRFEDFGLSFQESLRAGFLELAETFPQRVYLVDGTGDENTVFERVLAALGDRLNVG